MQSIEVVGYSTAGNKSREGRPTGKQQNVDGCEQEQDHSTRRCFKGRREKGNTNKPQILHRVFPVLITAKIETTYRNAEKLKRLLLGRISHHEEIKL